MQIKATLRTRQAITLALYAALFAAASTWREAGSPLLRLAYAVLCLLPHASAAAACVRNFRESEARHCRMGWALVGCSAAALIAGSMAGALTSLPGRHGDRSAPNFSDFMVILYGPLFGAGLFAFSNGSARHRQYKIALDSLLLSGAVAALVWRFLLRDLFDLTTVDASTRTVAMLYPFADLLTVFAALTIVGDATESRRHPAFLRGLALCAFIVLAADCTSAHNLLDASALNLARSIDALYFAAGCLIAHSAWNPATVLPEPKSSTRFRKAIQMLGTLAPYVLLAGTVVALVATDFGPRGAISQETFQISAALVVIAMVRQIWTLIENRWLTDESQRLNLHLEDRVNQRTQQLDGLLGLTRALSGTSEIDEVIDAALPHIRNVFNASASIIWISLPNDRNAPAVCRHLGLEHDPDALNHLCNLNVADHVEFEAICDSTFHCMRMPLEWQGESLGMVGVTLDRAPDADARALMTSVASELASTLESAYRRQLEAEAADRDSVTELFNHRAIQQRLESSFAAAEESGASISVMLVDISNFRLFNDTYGHQRGDSILKAVGQEITAALPPKSYLGRYGSDEFLAVMLGAGSVEAMQVAEELQLRAQSLGYTAANDDRTIPVALACGVATYPQDCADWHALPLLADENLFRAKRYGEQALATSPIRHLLQELRRNEEFETLDAMVTAVDNKDAYTRRHSEDVTQYALWLAEELGVEDDETLWTIKAGGLLHDVGKIGVPAHILLKPGRLTREEYDTLKRHPKLGALIVGSVPGMEKILDAVRSHHERWDGGGYPDATAGEATPWLGRLMAVADAFSAMTTDRPYRKGLPLESAISEIERGAGSQFDPAMAEAFLRAIHRRFERRLRDGERKAA